MECPLMKDALEAYVKKLDPEVQEIYRQADLYHLVTEDTGTDSFQIAAEILDVFEKYAKRNKEWNDGVVSDIPTN